LTARVIAVDHFAPEELAPNYRKVAPSALGHNSRGVTADAEHA
jgi:acyl-CoA dehydrogenase